jgi:Flp pilus assembly pilin Flp
VSEQEGRSQRLHILNALVYLHRDEAGQGLVEYLLILALVALGAIAGMKGLASKVNSAFNKVGSILGQYIS